MSARFRFAGPCREIPSALNFQEQRKACHLMGEKAGTDCSIELFFGFFFDGTRNNKDTSDTAGDHTHTNIARLWSVFDDRVDPSYSARKHRFRTYIEGVGTPCVAKVGDSGTGAYANAGAAAGWGGESRINWALLELQNNLFEHFTSKTLTEVLGEESPALVRAMSAERGLSRLQVENLAKVAKLSVAAYGGMLPGKPDDVQARRADTLVEKGRTVWAVHDATPNDQVRRTVLSQRNEHLRRLLGSYLTSKPAVERIRLSVFGFSRGAAQARVFINWLKDACDPAQGYSLYHPRGDGILRLGGIPVQVDFLGIYDTVASAGFAQSLHEGIWTGHGAWARKHDLGIPNLVRKCVHMVAAHEVRGSFPIDLAGSASCEEIVYPGVHSDVGGGYRPGEQGRGMRDSDKLSQIPLCDMYREAVQAGVPLRLDSVPQTSRERFAVSPELRAAFNAYVAQTGDFSRNKPSTRHIMYNHYARYLQWRRMRVERGPDWLGGIPSAIRARNNNPQDYEDLVRANDELLLEVRALRLDNTQTRRSRLPPVSIVQVPGRVYDSVMGSLRGAKERMWLDQIHLIWDRPERPAAAVIDLLDNYVHDSRAWFKPTGEDDDVWEIIQVEEMQALEERERLAREYAARGQDDVAREMAPNETEREALARYRANPKDLPLQVSGREFYWQWGYLRWRSVFDNQVVQVQREAQQSREDQQGTIRALQNQVDFSKLPRF